MPNNSILNLFLVPPCLKFTDNFTRSLKRIDSTLFGQMGIGSGTGWHENSYSMLMSQCGFICRFEEKEINLYSLRFLECLSI
jgi:hypothetical protein